ncbi:MAG: hypothetical protein K8S94_08705 [Planctomycetia bacterium]|nr:hypothetical protein [Planctomycetia bacterium]
MNTPPLDAAAVQALVAEVIRRIGATQPALQRAPASASLPAAQPVSATIPGFTIIERVVTLAHLERVPTGVSRVMIHASAVITPSARDRAKETGIVFVRGSGATPTATAGRPFMIAQAACHSDASGRAAAISRAIPHAQHLPSSGLADVITALAVHASKDAARGVLLTGRPAVAVILANRSASLRAVTARDAASLAAAATDAAANLLVVDPAAFPAAALERLCAEFNRTPSPIVPAELAAAPAGCGCKTHTH